MVAWVALAGLALSAASSSAGSAAAAASSIEGAQASADIEAMNRNYQRSSFEKELALQKPFYEAGKAALPLYEAAIKNTLDVTKLPLYQMQKGMIENSYGENTPQYIKDNALKTLGAQEGELAKTRLADIQQIGLGQAGSAGQSSVNFGSAFANSISREGSAQAQGQLSAFQEKQGMWNKAIDDTLSVAPYLASQGRRTNQQPLNGPQYTTDFQGRVVPVA